MTNLDLLIQLHIKNSRQGPGGEAQTLQALELAGLSPTTHYQIADVGCGTGAATLLLAQHLNAQITAVDLMGSFLEVLQANAQQKELQHKINTKLANMDNLPFGPQSLDVIWAEGAIYNMGFEAGIKAWKSFLKPGGKLVVSEITWLTHQRPHAVQQHWHNEYPEINTASAKIAQLEQNGYRLDGYFPLPKTCWLHNYYHPLHNRFPFFLKENNHSPEAQAIVEAEQSEIALYDAFSDFYSYGFYVASAL